MKTIFDDKEYTLPYPTPPLDNFVKVDVTVPPVPSVNIETSNYIEFLYQSAKDEIIRVADIPFSMQIGFKRTVDNVEYGWNKEKSPKTFTYAIMPNLEMDTIFE